MRRLALFAALIGACDDGGEGGPDAAPAPVTDMRVADMSGDARPLDMRPMDAQVDPDAAAPTRVDATPDATLADAALTDADLATDGAVDMVPPSCLATVIIDENLEIFQFEASRFDATAASGGADDTTVCSRAGVLPWTDVDLAGARAACGSIGFSVCSGAQWQQACVGPERWAYPYGPGYVAGTCNDHVAGSGALEVCGARPDCAGPTGIHDQNGNVWELTDDGHRRGASFKLTASMFRPEAGACEAGFVVPEGFFGRDVGFRCCRGLNLE